MDEKKPKPEPLTFENLTFENLAENIVRLGQVLQDLDHQLKNLEHKTDAIKISVGSHPFIIYLEGLHLREAVHKTRQNVHQTLTKISNELTKALEATRDTLVQNALPATRESERKEQ